MLRFYSDLGVEGGPECRVGYIYIIESSPLISFFLFRYPSMQARE